MKMMEAAAEEVLMILAVAMESQAASHCKVGLIRSMLSFEILGCKLPVAELKAIQCILAGSRSFAVSAALPHVAHWRTKRSGRCGMWFVHQGRPS